MSPEPDTLAVAQELAAEHGMELTQAAATVTAVVRLTAPIGEKIDALVEKVDALGTAVGGLRTEVGGLRTEVGGLRTEVGTVHTEIDGLAKRVDGLMWRFISVAVALVSGVAVVFGIALAAVRLTS